MLTHHLTITNQQVSVRVNEKESHQFSLLDLRQSKEELKDFFNNPRLYGEKLFNALFRDTALSEFNALSKQSERMILLVVDSPELDAIPWEYAYNKAKEEYVVEDSAFVRALPEAERPSNGRLKTDYERIPFLFIPANPLVDLNGEPIPELDEETEWKEIIKYITASNAGFDLLKMLPATPEQLQTVMAQFHAGLIVHFSGHGAESKDGALLLFECENGASNPVDAREFIREIKDKTAIAFLSACQSAVPEQTEFSNLARELVKAGVPFALGMQFNLPDLFAPNISGQFYNYLSRGHTVPEAARQARRAVKRENEFYVGMIALYAAHPDEAGKMGWSESGARTSSTFAEADVSDLPTPSGFIGRQRELMNIGTKLLDKKKPNTVTLHGAGGIGKTALMRQAVLRFAPSFESALAIALDPLPSLESMLGRLERFLNLPSPCSNNTKEREQIVREKLTGRETLLGLDNFETLNYALNEKGSDEEKTAKSLHSFFKYLAANGVTLCVTSREVTNLGGETIEDIQGLSNKNGGKLFQDNVVRQKEEIYIEKTQRVSEMVGGHPLALRLLASAFDDQIGTSLDQYIKDLQSFLPKARDKWTEEDRHESLRASFDFTMKRLLMTDEGEKLQRALARSSVFTAFFSSSFFSPVIAHKWPETIEEQSEQIDNIEEILQRLWKRSLLERTKISSAKEEMYLYRLHPALTFLAREQLTDAEITEDYCWLCMADLVRFFEKHGDKGTILTQIALHAVPDLLIRAESRNGDEAVDMHMQYRLSKVLFQFGLYEDSMRLLSGLRELSENPDRSLDVPQILSGMANTYLLRGEFDDAMKLNEQILRVSEGLNDKEGVLHALASMANIYVTRGNFEDAMKVCQQGLDIAAEQGDLRSKADMLCIKGFIYLVERHI